MNQSSGGSNRQTDSKEVIWVISPLTLFSPTTNNPSTTHNPPPLHPHTAATFSKKPTTDPTTTATGGASTSPHPHLPGTATSAFVIDCDDDDEEEDDGLGPREGKVVGEVGVTINQSHLTYLHRTLTPLY